MTLTGQWPCLHSGHPAPHVPALRAGTQTPAYMLVDNTLMMRLAVSELSG